MAGIENIYFPDRHNIPRLYRGITYQQVEPGCAVDIGSIGRVVCDVLAFGTIHAETVEVTFAHLNDGLSDRWLNALQEATARHQPGYRFAVLLRATPRNAFYGRYEELIAQFNPATYKELAVDPEPIRRGQLRSEMNVFIDTQGVPTVRVEALTENGLYQHLFMSN